MGCKRAQGFLEKNAMRVADHADARKAARGPQEVLLLAKAAHRIVVAKGKNVVTLDMQTAPPDDETLLSYLLGPTGKLRAPCLRKGKTLLVGFNEEAYRHALKT